MMVVVILVVVFRPLIKTDLRRMCVQYICRYMVAKNRVSSVNYVGCAWYVV